MERFDVDVDEAARTVRARFDSASLRVVTAVRDGAPAHGALSDADKAKIEQNIRGEVLMVRDYPDIRFVSTSITREGKATRVAGDLTLHGKTVPVTVEARVEGDRVVVEARLHQPDFGIKPYSAMLGTLKIKPGVLVRCSFPVASLPMQP